MQDIAEKHHKQKIHINLVNDWWVVRGETFKYRYIYPRHFCNKVPLTLSLWVIVPRKAFKAKRGKWNAARKAWLFHKTKNIDSIWRLASAHAPGEGNNLIVVCSVRCDVSCCCQVFCCVVC